MIAPHLPKPCATGRPWAWPMCETRGKPGWKDSIDVRFSLNKIRIGRTFARNHAIAVLLEEDQRSELGSAEQACVFEDRVEYRLQFVRRARNGAQHCRDCSPLFKEFGHLPLQIGLVHVEPRPCARSPAAAALPTVSRKLGQSFKGSRAIPGKTAMTEPAQPAQVCSRGAVLSKVSHLPAFARADFIG